MALPCAIRRSSKGDPVVGVANGAFAVGATALALALTVGWGTLNTMGGWQAAGTVRKALDLARQPRPVREAAGPWRSYIAMDARLTAPGADREPATPAPSRLPAPRGPGLPADWLALSIVASVQVMRYDSLPGRRWPVW